MYLGSCCRYIIETAKIVSDRGGSDWLHGLKNMSRLEVRKQLLELPGVGPKVADCVALFSLDQRDAIPVDTHVKDICVRDYLSTPFDESDSRIINASNMTPTIYEAVGDVFREKFQYRAGW
jgi:N-glycosylase/DNA lyase